LNPHADANPRARVRAPDARPGSRDVDHAISDVDQRIRRVDRGNTRASVSLLTVDRDSSEANGGFWFAGNGVGRSVRAFCLARDDSLMSDRGFVVASDALRPVSDALRPVGDAASAASVRIARA